MELRQPKLVAVNNPGGQPRQFCVQIREQHCQPWRRSAVFLTRELASQWIQKLSIQGVESRLVHYRLPTTA